MGTEAAGFCVIGAAAEGATLPVGERVRVEIWGDAER